MRPPWPSPPTGGHLVVGGLRTAEQLSPSLLGKSCCYGQRCPGGPSIAFCEAGLGSELDPRTQRLFASMCGSWLLCPTLLFMMHA